MVGWRSAAYAAAVLIGAAALIGALLLVTEEELSVHADFYQAAASILPVLLLSHLVRLGSLRDSILTSRDRIAVIKKRHADATARLESTRPKTKASTDPDVLALLQEADRQVAELDADLRDLPTDIGRNTLEVIVGNFVATLILATFGGSVLLAALASAASSNFFFYGTAVSLLWVVIALIAVEVLVFLSPVEPRLPNK